MAKHAAKSLRKKGEKELKETLGKERAHLRDLYFSLAGAQLKNIHEIKQTKRSIAAILTILNETKNNESR